MNEKPLTVVRRAPRAFVEKDQVDIETIVAPKKLRRPLWWEVPGAQFSPPTRGAGMHPGCAPCIA